MGGLVDVFLKCCGKCCLVTLHICRIVSRIGNFVNVTPYTMVEDYDILYPSHSPLTPHHMRDHGL